MLYYFLEFLPKQIDFIQISLQLYLKPNISISIKNEEKSNILSIQSHQGQLAKKVGVGHKQAYLGNVDNQCYIFQYQEFNGTQKTHMINFLSLTKDIIRVFELKKINSGFQEKTILWRSETDKTLIFIKVKVSQISSKWKELKNRRAVTDYFI